MAGAGIQLGRLFYQIADRRVVAHAQGGVGEVRLDASPSSTVGYDKFSIYVEKRGKSSLHGILKKPKHKIST
jgi:hypothetical protein